MTAMNILVTLQKGETRDIHFPQGTIDALNKLGNVRFNDTGEDFTQEDMERNINDIDICITHWGCPKFTKEVLDRADKLKLIAHAAGSVAYMVTDHVYDKGIRVCSANSIMAKFVAEGVLAYILSGLRLIPQHDALMKSKKLWDRKVVESRSLFGAKLGLVGLGTVGMFLLELLKPFNVKIRLYDPYIDQSLLSGYQEVELCSMEDALSWGDVISVHASLTPETYHMINKEKLKLVKDNALFVNTARGAVIDQKHLVNELLSGRFNAVLDVFEEEPLPPDNPLRNSENVILIPHMGGVVAREQMTYAIIAEIERFIANKPLKYEIPFEKYKIMTR